MNAAELKQNRQVKLKKYREQIQKAIIRTKRMKIKFKYEYSGDNKMFFDCSEG